MEFELRRHQDSPGEFWDRKGVNNGNRQERIGEKKEFQIPTS
jgi:hypothetical protein